MDKFEELLKALEESAQKAAERREPYIKALVDRLNISEEKASSLVFDANEISYTPNEFALAVEYYCDVFNGIENLEAFVKAQEEIPTRFEPIERKNTLFTMKPCTMFGNRMSFLQSFFQVEKDECISMVIANPSWLYHKEQYFIDKTQALIDLFGLGKKELLALCSDYPFVLGKRLNGLSSLIEKIATHYSVEERKVKDLMLVYPLLMNRGMSFYLQNNLGKEIFDRHWLLRCLSDYSPCNFGGYRTFANLLLVIDKIEADIGNVIKLYKKEYKDGTFIALLVERDNKKYLVSLGADTVTKNQRARMATVSPEQRLLEQIFGEKTRITEVQEYNRHQEYVCQLNTENENTINDILQVMASIASHSARAEVSLKPEGNAYYLSNSNDISQCSIEIISQLSNEEYNLNVSFYKVEPMGDGKMKVKALRKPIKKEKVDDLFDDELDNLFDDESDNLFDDDSEELFKDLFSDDEE